MAGLRLVPRRRGGTPLALVTHDAYSLSINGDVWQWTLLRSPKLAWAGGRPDVYAGRDDHTDQGPHAFAFRLLTGDAAAPEALPVAARQHGSPLVVFDRYEGLNRPPWGAVAPPRLWTGAEERAVLAGRMERPADAPPPPPSGASKFSEAPR